MQLVLKLRTVRWESIEKTRINHVHTSVQCLPLSSAVRPDFIEVGLDPGDCLNAFLLVAVVVLEACIFDIIALIEVILDLRAFFKIVFASDVLTARFKTDASLLPTIFVTIPSECFHTLLGSLSAFERASHCLEAFV